MNVEGIDGEQGSLVHREPIEIDVGNHKPCRAATRIPDNPLQVALDGDGGTCESIKGCDSLSPNSRPVVGFGNPLQLR
ncbi:hypothetical protein AAC387_Pa08g1413 [Persea americana]